MKRKADEMEISKKARLMMKAAAMHSEWIANSKCSKKFKKLSDFCEENQIDIKDASNLSTVLFIGCCEAVAGSNFDSLVNHIKDFQG